MRDNMTEDATKKAGTRGIYVHAEWWAAVVAEGHRQERSANWIVIRAVEEYIERQKGAAK